MSNSTITTFIINNGGLLLTSLVAIIGLIQAIISKNKQKVYTNIFSLVSDAELLANNAGIDKFNYVFDNAYNKLPMWLKWFISEDDIKRAIEYSLNKLKSFATQQNNKDTSIKATTEDAATNTNIQTPVDIATQTAQNTSSTASDSAPVSQAQQNIINAMHNQTPEENIDPQVKAEQM